jgi:EAL domain-containing protein (putative c-di-GMP-specific phosphodiesterase class I)
VLHELHDAGVRLSVDDFGTGYSSLAYLQRLPVNEVKIDKSFVRELGRDPDRTAIVRAIIDMGHILGLQVLAEGVEDEPTAQLLLDNGCDLAQGWLYSRALSPADFRTWTAAHQPAGEPAAEPWPAPRQR